MSLLTISILIVLALVLIILEIFVVPGVTVFGVGGFVVLVVSIYFSFASHGSTTGFIVSAISLLMLMSFFYMMSKKRIYKKIALNTEITSKVNIIEGVEVGDIGTTVSRLAPSGKIVVNDKIFEAFSISDFIDEDEDIEIVEVENNKIIVKHKS